MLRDWLALILFVLAYALFVVWPTRRSVVACAGAVLTVCCGVLTAREAICEKVSWNVIALLVGTLALAEMFMASGMPAVMAEWVVDRTRTVRAAVVAMVLFAGLLSAAVENVAVVLIVAPIVFSLAERLGMSPVRLLIFVAVSSNLQGTATLIGDPPSMIMAGYMGMTFNDFFIYQGKPGIFFAIQIGALASALVVFWFFRRHREGAVAVPVEKVRSVLPTLLMLALIVGLAFGSPLDPGFRWLAGTYAMGLAVVGLVWYRLAARWGSIRNLVKTLDWDTTMFLIGVFVLVGGLSDTGWLDRIAAGLATVVGGSLFGAFVLIVVVSVVVSGFVDNVPFILTMIPVAQKVADGMHAPGPLLMFGLLIGACLGGNITPIGASANVVAVGMLKKRGYVVSFGEFCYLGIPFTAAAVLSACAFVWWVWAP